MKTDPFKNFDWRGLQKYFSPHAADDLNAFLEKIPQHTGNTLLVIAVSSWMAAGAIGLYTTVQVQKLTELRAEFQELSALKPSVPTIKDVPVSKAEVSEFIEKIKGVYTGLSIKGSGSSILITSKTTANYGQFREAVGHVQNGGSGWRVNVDRLCVGRECSRDPLSASLKINKVSIR